MSLSHKFWRLLGANSCWRRAGYYLYVLRLRKRENRLFFSADALRVFFLRFRKRKRKVVLTCIANVSAKGRAFVLMVYNCAAQLHPLRAPYLQHQPGGCLTIASALKTIYE